MPQTARDETSERDHIMSTSSVLAVENKLLCSCFGSKLILELILALTEPDCVSRQEARRRHVSDFIGALLSHLNGSQLVENHL